VRKTERKVEEIDNNIRNLSGTRPLGKGEQHVRKHENFLTGTGETKKKKLVPSDAILGNERRQGKGQTKRETFWFRDEKKVFKDTAPNKRAPKPEIKKGGGRTMWGKNWSRQEKHRTRVNAISGVPER